MERLEPCPFCGKEPVSWFGDVGSDSSLYRYEIYCCNNDCEVECRVSKPTEAEAIAAWNRRAKPVIEPCEWCEYYNPGEMISEKLVNGYATELLQDVKYCPNCGRRLAEREDKR